MFSDTHFHFKLMASEWNINGVETLEALAQRDCFFGLDIGTEPDDLLKRQNFVEKTITEVKDAQLAQKIQNLMYFSAGIWPEVEYIRNRKEAVKQLEQEILAAEASSSGLLHKKIVALGECGLDHHWNPSGVDGRCESDFDEQTYYGEKEMFEMQLALAQKLQLPVIVHSRDAFEDTLDCIKNVGYHNGIIHCYSYGLEEARKFLDLGWYISFSGGVTYTKKSKFEDMQKLLKFVPEDRILCETDSPYLAPVPHRGSSNSPVLVKHVYEYVAAAREMQEEELSAIVDKNIRNLFKV